MAGVADSAFRLMAVRYGACLVYSELVSSEGLVRDSARTEELLHFSEEERPIGIQLFGSDPAVMAEAARRAEAFQPDLIDLNFGCPVKKVVKHGAGAALLRDLSRLGEIMREVVRAVRIPVTGKIRSGWDEKSVVAVGAARIIEAEGAAAVAVHPRTRGMGYAGRADWAIIRDIKQAVGIPVIGNGDIVAPQDAGRMIDETGCDAVMIGRGAMGRPWIFGQIRRFLGTGEVLPDPSPEERIRICLTHYDLAVRKMGERRALKEMRKHAAAYVKCLPGAAEIRRRLFQLDDFGEVRRLLERVDERTHGDPRFWKHPDP